MASNVQPSAAAPLSQGRAILVDRFAGHAGKLGVKVHRIATLDEVAVIAAGLAAEASEEARGVVIAPGLDEAQPALRQHLTAREVRLEPLDVADPGPTFARVTVGISEAVMGVAETGTLVVADALPDRLVRMLSPRHIVVLDAASIVPGLDEAGERLRVLVAGEGGPRANYVTFITGPSRTADIEMSLTVGAHGPAELHIAILGAAQA